MTDTHTGPDQPERTAVRDDTGPPPTCAGSALTSDEREEQDAAEPVRPCGIPRAVFPADRRDRRRST
jgi:hypothetical protein